MTLAADFVLVTLVHNLGPSVFGLGVAIFLVVAAPPAGAEPLLYELELADGMRVSAL